MKSSPKVLFFFLAGVLAFPVIGCDEGGLLGPGLRGGRSKTPGAKGGEPLDEVERQIEIQACSDQMKKYVGLGGQELTAGRAMAIAGDDRSRVKPYSALSGEFQRVLGTVPASLTAASASFSAAPDRWFIEPLASAVTLHTTYRIAFDGALALANTDPTFASAPTEATAATGCGTFMLKAWKRSPTSEEVDECKKVALGASAEGDPKRQWAHALAAVMTAAGFTTY